MVKAAGSQTWTEMLKSEGDQRTTQLLIGCMDAEVFLIHAVELVGIDWCIDRLREVKKNRGKVPRMIETVMGIKLNGQVNGKGEHNG